MTHAFEFVAKTKDGRVVHALYKGKSSRHSKVTKKIQEDLLRAYLIAPHDISELYIKPLKPENRV